MVAVLRDALRTVVKRFGRDGDRGAVAAEYAILISLIAGVVIAVVAILGTQVEGLFKAPLDALAAVGLPRAD